MKKITQTTLLVTLAAIALVGCKEESSSSSNSGISIGNVALLSPTYEIKAQDQSKMAAIIGIATDSFDSGMGESDFRSFEGQSGSQGLRSLSSRATETISLTCNGGGSGSMTASTNDVNGDELKENGTMTMNITYNNCSEYEWSPELNGSTSIEMSWRGYSNNDFESLTFSMTFNNFTSTVTGNSNTSEVSMVDGVIKMQMTSSNVAMAWALSVSGPETNQQIVTTRTTENLSLNYDNSAASGAWIVNGANGSKAEVTVVPNGLEVSINGGQAVIVN